MDSIQILRQEVQKGIKERFPNGMTEEYKERIDYELSIIESMGYADYHLVVKDFLEYGRLLGYVPKDRLQEAPLDIEGLKAFIKENGWKNQGMLTGPGRGSAAGSLVCYVLKITDIDPIKYGLLFERFLNPERISMPDIDSDISNTTRSKVIEYVKNKYGEEAVCGIMTMNSQAPKGALRIAAKYYGLKKNGVALTSVGDMLAKDVPSDVGTSFSSKVDNQGNIDKEGKETLIQYMEKKYASNKDAIEILKWARIMEGCFTAYGAHAAGVVISDGNPVSDYLPLRWNKKLGMMTTQCDMVQTEDNGLLKFDFLGLKTLDIITETLRLIEKNYGIIINPREINLADEKVYKEILSTGKTNSVFQFESAGMKTMLKRFKPTCFEDLIILVSMFRPGPLQYLDGVIEVKNGKKPMSFLCPQLEPILGKTYGAIVYQEQVMQICQDLASFTLGHADQVRRFMSKKKEEKLAHEREAFVDGCLKNNISEEISNTLFDQMMDFAKYAFNKSHAACYAYNAYVTAWLKCYYPAEFFASALNWASNKKIPGLMQEAKLCGVSVLTPDVNLSEKEFTVVEGCIRFGLSSVKGVKDNADYILSARNQGGKFNSLKEFYIRVKPNSTVVNNLISAGALDSFSDNRMAMKKMIEEISPIVNVIEKKTSFIASAKAVLPIIEKSSEEEIITLQENKGLKVEIKEVTTADKLQKRITNAENALTDALKEAQSVKELKFKEDKKERMSLEKEFLGVYVTEHPMNFYPSSCELGLKEIELQTEGISEIYGCIENLSIKARKKDGAKMAFFDLSDKTGAIEVCVFTKAYHSAEEFLKEGNVVRIKGKIQEKEVENETDDESEEPEVILQFIAESFSEVSPKKSTLLMNVKSFYIFHTDFEDYFKETYGDDNGHELIIYDEAMDEIRKMTYKVNESLLSQPGVSEI